MISKAIRTCVFMFLSFCTVFSVLTVNAIAALPSMPELEDGKASLRICCIYNDEKNSYAVDGAELAIFQVASVSVENGSVSYELLDSYKSLDIDFEGMTASRSNAYAKSLADLLKEKNVSGRSGTSDKEGNVRFDDLTFGIYLVKQTGKKGSAMQYSDYDPFLVLVPGISNEYEWIYDVKVNPKPALLKYAESETEILDESESETAKKQETTEKDTESKKKKSKEKESDKETESTATVVKSPKTGDSANIYVLSAVLFVSLIVLFFTSGALAGKAKEE